MLGIFDMFTERAEFLGISESGGLVVSAAVHKAYVDVSEVGTEAAAATSIVIKTRSGPLQITFDEPFMFFIRHIPTKTTLFIGRYVTPPPTDLVAVQASE
eukprot:GHVN01096966.1.p1 GENE.GHVN01096966.1~~GHVN01096966.1.p1  ORF type:complete len:100 (+),score=10.47 GHVN01096966.1:355-654(+)